VLLGITLAFYAFIGFEDMVDVAEEVKGVRKTMPRAILLTLGISTLLIVMASRVLYGLSSRGQLPAFLSRVNAATRTPLIATALATLVVLGLAWYGRLGALANATSMIMLTIFALVNLALWRLKGIAPAPPETYQFPRLFPLLGFLLSSAFVIRELAMLV
jgi:amino acid transporter